MYCFTAFGHMMIDGGLIPRKEAATKMSVARSSHIIDKDARAKKVRKAREDITVEVCSDNAEVELSDTYLKAHMRVIEIDVTVKDVRPGDRMPMMVSLAETGTDGHGYWHDTRAVTVPAHEFPTNRDVMIRRVRFEVPEDAKVSSRPFVRNFKVCVSADAV